MFVLFGSGCKNGGGSAENERICRKKLSFSAFLFGWFSDKVYICDVNIVTNEQDDFTLMVKMWICLLLGSVFL